MLLLNPINPYAKNIYNYLGVCMIMRNFNIKVNDLEKNKSMSITNSIKHLIEMFQFLDLRRFDQIIISKDVNIEINKIKKSKLNKNSSLYAKVITTIINDKIHILLILNKIFALTLIKNEKDEFLYKNALHVFHHELAHIHDYNKKIDIFEKQMLGEKYYGMEAITFPLAEICWSEYIANYVSSSSTKVNSFPLVTAQTLASLLISMGKEIKIKIMVFKSNKNRKDVFDDIKKDIEKILKTAAYLLGYLHGLNITLAQLCEKAEYIIEKSTFKDTWIVMSHELSVMRSLYPYAWDNLRIYKKLAHCTSSYYKRLGITLKEKESKELYFVVM